MLTTLSHEPGPAKPPTVAAGDGQRQSCQRGRRAPQLRFHIQSARLHLSDLHAGSPSPPSSLKTTELIIFLPAIPPAGHCHARSPGRVQQSRPVPFAGHPASRLPLGWGGHQETPSPSCSCHAERHRTPHATANHLAMRWESVARPTSAKPRRGQRPAACIPPPVPTLQWGVLAPRAQPGN